MCIFFDQQLGNDHYNNEKNFAAYGCTYESHQYQRSRENWVCWKLSVLEIPLDKELIANCLIETHTKLEEVILTAIVKYGLNRVHAAPIVVVAVPV